MVSSDGEPHRLLTVVAVGSGLLCAIVVLLVLVALIDCRRQKRTDRLLAKQQRSKSVFSLFAKRASLDITIVDERYLERCAVAPNGGRSSGSSGSTSSSETVSGTSMGETMKTMPAPATWRTTMQRMDETIFDASGKLHGIATVSC